ncbi:MAG: hypothetical protein IPO01_00295 [Chitinophagaceae bacterium]|nr:hypothetical protein [Chitinophagaceae bacterium]MBL0200792.1 hypothetical protein [Chitinophagaceae bacterium]
MKIVKSLLLLAVSICTTTILFAQEIKTEIAKPIEVKIPAANNKPSPQPELKPQPQVAATPANAPAAAETPSPLTRKEDAKPVEKEKLEVKTLNKNDIATPGGEEGRKIMEGKSTQPAPEINSQSTIEPRPALQVKTPRPVNGKQQQ